MNNSQEKDHQERDKRPCCHSEPENMRILYIRMTAPTTSVSLPLLEHWMTHVILAFFHNKHLSFIFSF